jgi:prephenate dehydrogenase
MKQKIVGIIGLGLIGGSLGLALQDSEKYRIIGFDRNEKHRKEAIDLGIVDEVVSFEEILKVDILFLAIPVDGIISVLQNIENYREDITIIDMGSTKRKIVEAVPQKLKKNFVPAHPMAGTEKSGPSASFKTLYKDRVVVLCDLDEVGEKQKMESKEIFEYLQMRIIYMNSLEHDTHTAWISHLPHAISFALANSVMAQEKRDSILNLSAGGFRDMSRLAKSSPNMWRDVFHQNRENLLSSIDYFQKELSKFRDLIEKMDWEELEIEMKKANRLHEIL